MTASQTFQLLRRLSLSGMAVTAQIDADGTLRPITSTFEKLLAAARERSLPRIHTVIVAQDQDLDRLALLQVPYDPHIFIDPNADFRVIRAGNLHVAIQLVVVDAETRWGPVIDQTAELRRHRDFIGRQWLAARVREFIDKTESGYFLINGGPGVGKSAFIASQISTSGPAPVYHFIRHGMGDWDEPDAVLRSLTAQLRRKYALHVTETEARQSAAAAFVSILTRVSYSLAPGEKETIYLDGLDEAFGPRSAYRSPSDMLPTMLPRGITMVVTSRHLELFDWRAERAVCDLEADSTDNLADIRAYLRGQNRAQGLGLDDAFIERLFDASEGYFVMAVLFLRERRELLTDLETWRDDPKRIPRDLSGWLLDQWNRVLGAAQARGIQPSIVHVILGLPAMAREPLSRDHLLAFLAALQGAGRQEDDHWFPTAEVVRHLDTVLALAVDLFDRRDPTSGATAPYRFFHSGFAEFITNQLSGVERDGCHEALARGCTAVAQSPGRAEPVSGYALRHRLHHLIAAKNWQGVAQAFGEASFIADWRRRFGFHEVHAAALAAASNPYVPPQWREGFRKWERFLRWRVERLEAFPAAYSQEVCNEFLSFAPPALANALDALRSDSDPESIHLHKVSGPPALRELGHMDWVEQVTFSPDGNMVASASKDRTVKIWGVTSGRALTTCQGHTSSVTSLAFSPDGSQLASGSWDSTAKVWDVKTGRLQRDFRGHTAAVTSLAFSPDGSRLATASVDRSVKVWDTASGQMLADCRGHKAAVTSVAFSPDGSRLASTSNDQTVKIWAAVTGYLLADCQGHTNVTNSVTFSPDGSRLASAGCDATVKVWNAEYGDLLVDCQGHTHWVESVAFSPDGSLLASASVDRTVKIWDVTTGHMLADCRGHEAPVNGVAFSPSASLLASAGDDHTVIIWDVTSGHLLAKCQKHSAEVTSVAFSPDGHRLASASKDHTVKVWDADSGHMLTDCLGHTAEVTSVAFSRSGSRLATATWGRPIKIRKSASGSVLSQCRGHSKSVTGLDFSPDSRRLASASADHTVRVWDAVSGRLIAVCTGHTAAVTGVVFSPSGRRLASSSNDRTTKVWDPGTGRILAECQGHADSVIGIAFSPDGRWLATVSWDRTIKVWNAASGRLLTTCDGHTDSTTSVAFSPDGSRLASASMDHTVKVWETKTGRLAADCRGHTNEVWKVVFSTDGRRLASASDDQTAKIWDAQSGHLLADCQGHQDAVANVAFAPAGRYLASASGDQTVKLWAVGSGKCLSTLFYDSTPAYLQFVPANPPRLLIADGGGRPFRYRVANVNRLAPEAQR